MNAPDDEEELVSEPALGGLEKHLEDTWDPEPGGGWAREGGKFRNLRRVGGLTGKSAG